jgi:hypothetical protein
VEGISCQFLMRKMDDAEIDLVVREGLAQNWAPQRIGGRKKQRQ